MQTIVAEYNKAVMSDGVFYILFKYYPQRSANTGITQITPYVLSLLIWFF